MDRKQLTEYLKNVAELEASVYSQIEILNTTRRKVRYVEPKKEKLTKPEKPIMAIEKPAEPKYESLKFSLIVGGISIFFLVLSIISLLLNDIFYMILCGLFCIFGLFITIVFIRNTLSQNAAKKYEYENQLKKYEKEKITAEIEYEQKMQQYKKELAEYNVAVVHSEENHNQKIQNAKHNYELARSQIGVMENKLEETANILKKLYSLNIVFPKYREMAAMCTIYEYFMSGRCTELEGPNGAYNLYESELRQNIIIGQLDNINKNLELVQKNQYLLYNEIKETNRKLQIISNEVQTISQNTQKIMEYSAITAYCSQITAQNTEALKYIALVNG